MFGTSNNHNQPKGVQEDERSLLIDYYVQKVSEKLRKYLNPSDIDKKRWIWELLQNAKDSISNSTERESVDIEVIEHDNYIIFKHNGEPFSPKTLNSLIWQKSGEKRGDSESTGRFGTGFLTTHTLSQNVFLESILIDTDGSTWAVNVNLCREGERDEELREGIEKTLNSRNYNPNPTNFWTIFKYELKTQTNKESAAAGINSLGSNIFFTLAFADKIKSIKLITKNTTLLVTKSEETNLEHFKIVRFSVSENEKTKSISVIFASSTEYNEELSKKYKQERYLRYSIAIQVSEDTKEVLPILADTPHLYCVFPLVGSEDFHFPVIINSPDFEPVTERDRLLLAGNEYDDEKQEITNEGINKLILSNALTLYSEILSYLSTNGWKNIHLLAKGAKKAPSQDRDFDKDWYKEKIQAKLRQLVLDTPMVETANGLQKLNDIYFPKADKKDQLKKIWEFTNDITPEKLPKLELIDEWSKLIWDECHSQTVKELAKQVSEFQNTTNLNKDFEWLNNLLLFILEADKDCLNEYPLIPNTNGDFKTLEYENLSQDSGLPNCSFKILEAFGIDWKDIVVKNISAIKFPLSKGYKELSDEVNSQIKQKSKSKDDSLLNSTLILLSVVPTKNENISDGFIEKRKTIWTFSRDIFNIEQPDTFEADNLDETLWEECDEWIIKEMIKKISAQNSIQGLTELNANLQIKWLDNFIGFVTPLIKKDLLKQEEFKILPNQYGDFCTLLAKDKDIPEELKEEIFINIGIDLKFELLNNEIDSFIPEKETTISEVAIRINDLLLSDIDNEIQNKAVLRLISLIPNEKKAYQEKLWNYAKVMYGSDVSPLTELNNSHSTLWTEANKYLISKIVSDIEAFVPIKSDEEIKSSIAQFSEYLKGVSLDTKRNWDDFSVLWLSEFIDFLHKNELKIGAIVPNQNDNFELFDKLDKDDEIHEDLKNILCKLDEGKDFRNYLIHTAISIQPTHSKNTKDIAREINDLVHIGYDAFKIDSTYGGDNFKEAIRLLVLDWFINPQYPYSIKSDYNRSYRDINDKINKDLFGWCYNERFELETNVLSTIEQRRQSYRLNSTIREQGIPFEEAIIIRQSEYDDLKAEVERLKIETNTTEVESLISKFNLTEDKIRLLLAIEEKAKRFEGTSNYLEQSAQAFINETGIKGEEIVFEYLTSRFNKNRVRWVSRSDKNEEGIEEHRYDFEVLEEDLTNVMWYIDAKATITGESQSDKIPILIRKGTWDFIRESDADKKNIFLARVFGASSANSEQVQLLKIQYYRNK
ncbi:MAG TPA: hypothetical protein DCM71_27420 [Runella sp.]|nr:hypothetical protein [Runella sp.]